MSKTVSFPACWRRPAWRPVLPTRLLAQPFSQDGSSLPSLAPMLDKVRPAVVNISTEGRVKLQQNPLYADPFFRHFFRLPEQPLERKTQSLGSGVIVDAEEGLILTNSHVIANAVQITVTLLDGRQLAAERVGDDPETDVALIRVPSQGLSDMQRADSEQLRVGDFVVAIGNPFGLSHTVTSGIVSGLGRSGLGIEGYEDFIQTDAAINPGNSGGALVNLDGELVGINTAIFSRSGGSVGIGFAIPINLAMQIVEQLLDKGEVTRGFLGVVTQDIDDDLAKAFGLDKGSGVVVANVMSGSSAERAGLRAGDVILSLDGKPVRSSRDLRNRIGLTPVGENIRFVILRAGKRRTMEVTIGSSRERRGEDAESEEGSQMGNKLLRGVTLGDIGTGHPRYGELRGVVVVDVPPGGPAWRAKLRPGDIITSVNLTVVDDLDSFLREIDGKEERLVLRIIRGDTAGFIVIK